jgi:hypothetical protein
VVLEGIANSPENQAGLRATHWPSPPTRASPGIGRYFIAAASVPFAWSLNCHHQVGEIGSGADKAGLIDMP